MDIWKYLEWILNVCLIGTAGLRKPMASSHSCVMKATKSHGIFSWRETFVRSLRLLNPRILHERFSVLVFVFRCQFLRQFVPSLVITSKSSKNDKKITEQHPWPHSGAESCCKMLQASRPFRIRSSCLAPGGSMSPVVVKCHGFSAQILTTPSPTSARAWGAAKSKAKAAATTSRPQATGQTRQFQQTQQIWQSPMQTNPFLLIVDDPCWFMWMFVHLPVSRFRLCWILKSGYNSSEHTAGRYFCLKKKQNHTLQAPYLSHVRRGKVTTCHNIPMSQLRYRKVTSGSGKSHIREEETPWHSLFHLQYEI